MDTIFMNSENSKTSKPHALILKLINKSYLRINGKIICLIKSLHLLLEEKYKKLMQQQ